jgi:hypothetical protein
MRLLQVLLADAYRRSYYTVTGEEGGCIRAQRCFCDSQVQPSAGFDSGLRGPEHKTLRDVQIAH